MGLNVNLRKMLALPASVSCPKCGVEVDPRFEDYDIECGRPNPEPGRWELGCWCSECEHSFKFSFTVAVARTGEGPSFNHTRADGPFDPCPECLERMSRDSLLALAKDLQGRIEDLEEGL